VEITYDPEAVTYQKLLDVFWSIHDPTQLNRQGPDIGTNYRSAIFYHTSDQKRQAEESKELLRVSGRFGSRRIVTEIVPAGIFWPAEEYHQQYFEKQGRSGWHR
jgi:peptide-methionine (S)-S-oxide reductase